MEHESENRICQNCKGNFVIEPDDFSFYEKIKVPAPTFCPECRLIRRLRARNERSLFKVHCDLCSKSIITMYNPEDGYVIYCPQCYLSDQWDPLSYGRDYDFSRPFFEQWRDLLQVTPRRSLHGINPGKNTDYANYLVDASDIFLSYSVVRSEEIYHCRVVDMSKQCIDCTNIKECESCYGLIQGTRNYNSKYLMNCRDCIDSAYLYDCVSCSSCFMSANLRNKQYVYKGIQLTKEEYREKMIEEDVGSYQRAVVHLQEFKELLEQRAIHRFAKIFKSVDCTGDNIENSKNVKKSFEIFQAENAKFGLRLTDGPSDLYDVTGSGKSELIYEASGAAWGSRNSKFFIGGNATVDSDYCDFCISVSNAFGSISLNGGKYIILNKQYTKEEYEELLPKIIKHMNDMPYIDPQGKVYAYGEFFPQICIPHAYNESTSQEYFPLEREEALRMGYKWRNDIYKDNKPTILIESIPDTIDDIEDTFINEAIPCAHSGECKHQCTQAFRLQKNELLYIKKLRIPIPRVCPNCRHYERLELKTPLKLWHRSCMCDKVNHGHTNSCPNEFETSYEPGRPEKVYCEQCYQKEVL